METIQESAQSLKQAWENLKESEPQLRIRDAAAKLGVTEAQLLATGIGANVIRLAPSLIIPESDINWKNSQN